jgi:hypothetical protein
MLEDDLKGALVTGVGKSIAHQTGARGARTGGAQS